MLAGQTDPRLLAPQPASGPKAWRQDGTQQVLKGAVITPINGTGVATSVKVEAGDTDAYPHEGSVAWDYRHEEGGTTHVLTRYQYASKSGKWRRKEKGH